MILSKELRTRLKKAGYTTKETFQQLESGTGIYYVEFFPVATKKYSFFSDVRDDYLTEAETIWHLAGCIQTNTDFEDNFEYLAMVNGTKCTSRYVNALVKHMETVKDILNEYSKELQAENGGDTYVSF
jgi:hypothetical protein